MATIKISQLSELTADTDVTSNDLLQIINIEQTSSTFPTGTNRKIKASTLANGLSRLSTTIPQVIQTALDSKVSLENFNSAGLKIAIPVVAASPGVPFTLSNITPSSSMDGVTLVSGNRVLLKDQSAPAQNGIYVVQTTGSPLRATDFNEAIEINDGYVLVDGGNTLKGSSWVVTSDVAVVGTDPIVFTQFSSAVTGLSKSAVGLGNVDNTSDLNKPVSTATATALNLKANIANPTFSGTVGGITKSMVGLGNVINTSDADKPVSTATQTALNLKANLASPNFSGNVALPSTTTVNGVTVGPSLIPAGAVMAFAMNSAPEGWLACNGDTIPNGSGTVQSKTADFSILHSLLGTTYGSAGKLPDLRGYFVRGSGTNSDGTAAGTFGDKQADSFANHSHTINSGQQNGISNGCGANNTYQKANDYACGLGATGTSGGTETRPKNIAMLYCIKF
jgi:microcystin-dependent protein